MEERVLQARVGIMVISAMLLTAILVLIFGKTPRMFSPGKTVTIKFPSAPGVSEGTPVRKGGILIGRVENVSFDEGSSDVLVTVRIHPDRDIDIYDNETPRATASLLGDAVVEFVPDPNKKERKPIPSGQQIAGTVSASPVELFGSLQGQISDSLNNVGRAGDEVSKLAKNINNMLEKKDGPQLEDVLTKTAAAMENFREATDKINRLLGTEKELADLKQGISGVPKIMEDTRRVIVGMEQVVASAKTNMENLEGLTGPLKDRGGKIAARLDSSVEQLDQFMTQLVDITAKFGNEDGTLSRLMNDPELYNQVSSAARNINDLTVRLRPIIEDVRVFSDEIARDPGQLGLSGVFKKRTGTKYPNYGSVPPPPDDFHDPLPGDLFQIVPQECER